MLSGGPQYTPTKKVSIFSLCYMARCKKNLLKGLREYNGTRDIIFFKVDIVVFSCQRKFYGYERETASLMTFDEASIGGVDELSFSTDYSGRSWSEDFGRGREGMGPL